MFARGEGEGRGRREMSEVDWEVQTSSCNVNESWIWNVQCGEYSQWLCNVWWQTVIRLDCGDHFEMYRNTESLYSVFYMWKYWCFQTVVLEKLLEGPLDSKEIKPVNPKGSEPWTFIGRMDAEAEGPLLWPPDMKSQFTGKDPDAGKDWGQEEKRETEDEMVGWRHRLNGHESEQTPGDGEGQGSLASCSPWGHKESDMA